MRPLWWTSAAWVLAACAPPHAATPYPDAEPPEGVDPASTEPRPEPAPGPEPVTARYFDREIDLRPFLAGFPFGDFEPSLRTGKLFYVERGERYTLRMLDIGTEAGATERFELAAGTAISDVDWSKRSLWSVHHHAPTQALWLHADASNDEQMNLWTLDLQSGALTQVTQHDYVYGLGFSPDESIVAYLPRQGRKAGGAAGDAHEGPPKKAPYETCLVLRTIATGAEQQVVCDSPDLTFSWSEPRFSPDGQEIYFNAQVQGDRNRAQLVRVDLRSRKRVARPITSTKARRNAPRALDGWVDDDLLLYIANDDGFANLYAYSRSTQRTKQLTRYTEDVTSAELLGDEVVAVHRTPAGSTLVRLDARTGNETAVLALPGTADVTAGHGRRALVTQRSPDIVHETHELDLATAGLLPHEVIGLDPQLERGLVACRATAVRIPTFDQDPATGTTRQLHAFLLEPRDPVPEPEQRLAMITAFYGGENRYSTFDQIMCAAGLTVISPAVRGSTGFGKAFYSLNDKDLGGDEIVDLFMVARWIEQRLDLPSSRIGVYGGSHGGYATMRALTFPSRTNGRNDFYPFGFGMAHAGFSDIKTFYDATNIPDWVVLESGDPSKPAELEKMRDRSPLTHAERLRAPLLVTHGSQDWRVPVQESRQFVDKTKQAGLPVQYVEFEGQGHHIEGLDLQAMAYQVRFDFLRAVAEAATEGG
ncbi:S9 family peptidase [Paraliomyxa miuraensis]|uniref:S9 family peptidase n=1 Tax=Paraliomyxa miuraensis TaxID=376150 RepID=UPI0022572133|nr:prolyl oligopeptidase family serine peptidase [Paraliomyxa miuraensis]MCX4241857.1 prolyl oligopeptidase family serine peptidase [Paraliomyxa miuraensis]